MQDIELVAPGGRLGAAQVHALLHDPGGVEWRARVGVAGAADGSAKTSTRLLCAQGWVAKTCMDDACSDKDAARVRLLENRTTGLEAGLWHPDKQWAVFRGPAGWQPLTLCPELNTLRQLRQVSQRMAAWLHMFGLAIETSNRHGLGLDLNPANFGTEPSSERLYYIDDELYAPLLERELAGAIIARIPEEPGVGDDAWRAWTAAFLRQLQRAPLRDLDWERLCEELGRYPVAQQFEQRRHAVLTEVAAAIRRVAATKATGRRRAPAARLTCVFGDVHANLPALEAALKSARELGADSYLFVGDAVGYGPHPGACIQRLAQLRPATLLRGNHDHAIATGRLELGMNRLARRCAEWTMQALSANELAWLAGLQLEHASEQCLAVHGAPRDPHKFLAYVYELTYEDNLRYLREREVALCFYGHTHVPLVHMQLPAGPTRLSKSDALELTPRRTTLVNPGSVGQPRDGDPRAAFALWDRARSHISFHRVSYDVSRTLRDLQASGLPAELGTRLSLGL